MSFRWACFNSSRESRHPLRVNVLLFGVVVRWPRKHRGGYGMLLIISSSESWAIDRFDSLSDLLSPTEIQSSSWYLLSIRKINLLMHRIDNAPELWGIKHLWSCAVHEGRYNTTVSYSVPVTTQMFHSKNEYIFHARRNFLKPSKVTLGLYEKKSSRGKTWW